MPQGYIIGHSNSEARDSLVAAGTSPLDLMFALFLPDLVFRSGWHEQSDDEANSGEAGDHSEEVEVVLLVTRDHGIIDEAKADVENDITKGYGTNHRSSILLAKNLRALC